MQNRELWLSVKRGHQAKFTISYCARKQAYLRIALHTENISHENPYEQGNDFHGDCILIIIGMYKCEHYRDFITKGLRFTQFSMQVWRVKPHLKAFWPIHFHGNVMLNENQTTRGLTLACRQAQPMGWEKNNRVSCASSISSLAFSSNMAAVGTIVYCVTFSASVLYFLFLVLLISRFILYTQMWFHYEIILKSIYMHCIQYICHVLYLNVLNYCLIYWNRLLLKYTDKFLFSFSIHLNATSTLYAYDHVYGLLHLKRKIIKTSTT